MTIKRIVICLFLCLSIMCLCFVYLIYEMNCTHGVYEIDISAYCISNNSVGNGWQITYNLDGKNISSETRLTVPLDYIEQKTIKTTIIEHDKWDDIASQNITFFLRNGEEKTSKIVVSEDEGRFKGNIAVWEVNVSVKLIKKVMLKQ